MTGGTWRIGLAYPAVSASSLLAALALSREASRGEGFLLRDEREMERVKELARHDDIVMGLAPPEGLVLGMRSRDLDVMLGSVVFAARFSGVWPVWKPAVPTRAQAAADRAASLLSAYLPKP